MLVKIFEATGSACVLRAYDVLLTRNDYTLVCVLMLSIFIDGNFW